MKTINNANVLSIEQIAECFEYASIELENHFCASDNSRLSINDVLSVVGACLRMGIREMFSEGLQQLEGKFPSALAEVPTAFNPATVVPSWVQTVVNG